MASIDIYLQQSEEYKKVLDFLTVTNQLGSESVKNWVTLRNKDIKVTHEKYAAYANFYYKNVPNKVKPKVFLDKIDLAAKEEKNYFNIFEYVLNQETDYEEELDNEIKEIKRKFPNPLQAAFRNPEYEKLLQKHKISKNILKDLDVTVEDQVEKAIATIDSEKRKKRVSDNLWKKFQLIFQTRIGNGTLYEPEALEEFESLIKLINQENAAKGNIGRKERYNITIEPAHLLSMGADTTKLNPNAKENAAYFTNALQNMVGKKIHFYPGTPTKEIKGLEYQKLSPKFKELINYYVETLAKFFPDRKIEIE